MTRPRLTRLLAALAASLFLIPAARAAEEQPSQPSQPRAVLVGISDYADKQIKARKHAQEDAQALYDLLTSKDHLKANPKDVRLLLGKPDDKRDSQPATRANVLKALEWLAAESKPGDLAVFVFLGEGGPLGAKSDRRCYFASDSTFKDRNKTAVAAAEVEERLRKLKGRLCAFVDVDFRGFTDDAKVPETTLSGRPYPELLGDDGTEEHNFLPGRVAYLATNGLSTSVDLKDHGLFTTVLLDALKGSADKDGYEPDGVVTVDELTEFLNDKVPALAQKHGKTDAQKGQVHFILGDRSSPTPLSFNPAAHAGARERLEKFDKLVVDKKLSDKLAEEGRGLLRQMPQLKAQQELRKAYQRLADGALTVEKFTEKRDEVLASVKLDRDVAEKFADKVLEGSDLLLEEFVRKVTRGELVANAVRGMYRKVNERLPESLSGRLADAKNKRPRELRQLLIDARLHLGKREDLAGQKDIDLALARMLGGLRDPYTTYIDPETLDQFKKGTEGRYVGIGVQIRKDRDNDMLLVVTPLKGSPAHKAGIKAGDHISTITLVVNKEGKPLDKPEVIPTRGLGVQDAVTRIKGKPGSKVKLTILRKGEDKPLEMEVERNEIEMETVMGYQRKSDDEWDFMVDPTTRVGYVRVSQFTRHTAKDVEGAVKELKKKGVRGVVLDLRFNPGGLLHSAREICDLFIDDGLIVSIRPREGREQRELGFADGSELGFPMAVLVNGGSASGSEIVAACLQDHGRAVVMGERSYGKGSVQNVVPFAGGEIKLTTASFWRPSGKNLNKASTKGGENDEWGVVPNKGYDLKLDYKETEDLEESLHEAEVIYAKGAARKRANPEFKDRQLDLGLKYLRDQLKLSDRLKGKG